MKQFEGISACFYLQLFLLCVLGGYHSDILLQMASVTLMEPKITAACVGDGPGMSLNSHQVPTSPPTRQLRGHRVAYLVTNRRQLGVFLSWW